MKGGASPAPGPQLDAARLWRVAVPLCQPFEAAHGAMATRRAVLVELVADGLSGWGECAALSRPTYTGEWVDGAWAVLRDELVPAVLAGHDAEVRGHPMASAAVEAARCDLVLRSTGRPLVAALGAERRRLDRTQVVASLSPAEATEAVGRAVASGCAAVKLKVHAATARTVAGAVRAAFPAVSLALDANGSWGRAAPEELAWVDDLGLLYLEQPLDGDDLVGHAALAASLDTPVALDESLGHPGLVDAALALRAADVVNVKPARLGGLAAARRVLDACARAGVPAFCGGMVELGVGRAAAAAVAALEACTLPTDLGPSYQYVAEDLAGPVLADGAGRLVVPEGPGIGVEVDRSRLRRAAEAVVELRP